MAEELARAASSDQMLRNLKLTGLSTLQEGCVEIYRRRKRLQEALVLQCLFYTQYVAKATQALTPKTEVRDTCGPCVAGGWHHVLLCCPHTAALCL